MSESEVKILEKIEKIVERNTEESLKKKQAESSSHQLSRRRFLKLAGLGLGALSLSSLTSAWSILQPSGQGTSGIDATSVEGESASNMVNPTKSAFRARVGSEGSNSLPYVQGFDNVVFNINNDYDGVDTFTAPVSGVYHFDVGVREEEYYDELGTIIVRLLVNGNIEERTRFDSGNEAGGVLSADLKLSSGDNVKVEWDSTSSSTGSFEANESYFGGHLVFET
jgi:hypothetical protein